MCKASGAILVGLVLSAAAPATGEEARPPVGKSADLVLLGGKIVTVDDRRPRAEALAVRGDRIIAVGDDPDVRHLIGDDTRVIDLAGRLAIPGLIEGHGHFVSLGRSKMILDLSGVRNFDQIVRLVRQAACKAAVGEWIVGRGWHQSKWDKPPEPNVDGCPTHHELSKATPENPVLLTHASGHMCLANAKAMELAGVERTTASPSGGQILRDRAGEPIGAFRETAMGLIRRAHDRSRSKRTAKEAAAELDEAIRLATAECLANGITTFHDAGESFATIDRFRQLARRGRLKVRLWVMIGEPNEALATRLPEYRLVGLGNNHLTVRAIKRLIDGALGTHGAWLLEPYDDLPDSSGLNTTPVASLRRTARLAVEHGFQLCVHAIGDRANRETLDLFAEVFKEHPQKTDLRWRIEHAQHLSPADIPRFAPLGVIAAMQGIHCTSDAPFVVKRLGIRRAEQGAYVWKSLLDSGAVVINGTDAPVEKLSPIECFYASVTRKRPDGEAFFARQRMTRQQALRSYTLAAAHAGFEEDLKGSLVPGKLADVVVLSKDIMSVPEQEIRQARVVYTIVGGKVLYER
jgi:predicted amidohydrolase YtcJ